MSFYITNACVECGICAQNCPAGAITQNIKKRQYEINTNMCIGCGACAARCPVDAPMVNK